MANDNNERRNKSTKAPTRLLSKAKFFYKTNMCGCSGRANTINCIVPQTNTIKGYGTISSSSEENDLQDLMRILARKNSGGAKVDVDSDGNLVLRKPAMEESYSFRVGKMGRIEEDKLCYFNEADVNKFWHTRCGSYAINTKKILV